MEWASAPKMTGVTSVKALPGSSASLSLGRSREMLVCVSAFESLACEAEWIKCEHSARVSPPPLV